MDTLEAIRRRRTIRSFRPDPVDLEALNRILEAGRHAPSGANRQPWRFYLVEDPEAKAEIRRHCEAADQRWHRNAPAWLRAFFDEQEIRPDKPFLTIAPHLICVFAERGNPYWRESAWIAVGYMALQATAEGLATVTYTPGQTRYLNQILRVPVELVPICILPIGHPDEAPSPRLRPRRPLEETSRRVESFRRLGLGAAAGERPAAYGHEGGAHIPSIMDSRETVVALLSLTRVAGSATEPAGLVREALTILARLVRFEGSAVRLSFQEAAIGDAALLDPNQAAESPEGSRRPAQGSTETIRVPLEVGGDTVGLLALTRRSGRGFSEPEVDLVRAFAQLLALAVEGIRLRTG